MKLFLCLFNNVFFQAKSWSYCMCANFRFVVIVKGVTASKMASEIPFLTKLKECSNWKVKIKFQRKNLSWSISLTRHWFGFVILDWDALCVDYVRQMWTLDTYKRELRAIICHVFCQCCSSSRKNTDIVHWRPLTKEVNKQLKQESHPYAIWHAVDTMKTEAKKGCFACV